MIGDWLFLTSSVFAANLASWTAIGVVIAIALYLKKRSE